MSSTNAFGNLTSQSEDAAGITLTLVREEYDRADGFCAEVQSFRGEAGIPAINELRNSGKHLLDALDDDGNVASLPDLQSALGHARRAAYEAYEAGILTALEIIAKFKRDYATVAIAHVVPRYPEIMQRAIEAQKAIENGRRRDFRRDGDHTERMIAFRGLREACDYLDANREEANKVLQSERRSSRNGMFALLLTIIGILIGIPSFLDWVGKHDWSPDFLKIESAQDLKEE